jgi:hypothetical protein
MSSLFKKPEMKPVVPMPDPEGPEALAAKRRELQTRQMLSGRASTDLSGRYDREKLGMR